MTLINIFAVSAIIMVVMVLFKMLEIKLGRDIISKKFRNALDDLIIDIWKISINWLKRLQRNTFHQLKKIPVFFLHLLIDFWSYALRKTLQAVSLVQGRGDGSARGTVSAHLRSIESYREHLKHREEK